MDQIPVRDIKRIQKLSLPSYVRCQSPETLLLKIEFKPLIYERIV